jgi:glutathione S-transferase
MKLYYSPGACSLSPHIALAEAGLAYSLERVDLATKVTETGVDFFTINPIGFVPVLQLDDGQFLTEGPAIVQWIADQAPAARLAPPAGSIGRARLQEALNFISTELHKTFSPLFNPAAPEEWKTFTREVLGRRLDVIEKKLAGWDYLLGDFSVADGYLFTFLGWGRLVQFDVRAGRPLIAEFIKRMQARPGVQQALREEGLLK